MDLIPFVPFTFSLACQWVNLISVLIPLHSLACGSARSTTSSYGVLGLYPTGLIFFWLVSVVASGSRFLLLCDFSFFLHLNLCKLLLHFNIGIINNLNLLLLQQYLLSLLFFLLLLYALPFVRCCIGGFLSCGLF